MFVPKDDIKITNDFKHQHGDYLAIENFEHASMLSSDIFHVEKIPSLRMINNETGVLVTNTDLLERVKKFSDFTQGSINDLLEEWTEESRAEKRLPYKKEVRIDGLTAVALNNKIGTVVGWNIADGRVMVHTQDDDKTRAIKKVNLFPTDVNRDQ